MVQRLNGTVRLSSDWLSLIAARLVLSAVRTFSASSIEPVSPLISARMVLMICRDSQRLAMAA
jgi:hypothetical protein